MNVLILCKHDFYYGGVGEVLRHLTVHLPDHGVNPILASSHPSARRFAEEHGGEVHIVRLPRGLLNNPFHWVRDVRALKRLAESRSVELCHAHSAQSPGVAARALLRRLRLPYVVTTHGDLSPQFTQSWGMARSRRIRAVLRDAAAVTHLTETMAEFANAFADHSDRCHLVPNGCDVEWWRQEPCGTLAMRRPYVLALSRLEEGKGLELLIRAHDQAVRAGCDISLVVAGDGRSMADLIREAEQTRHPVLFDLGDLAQSDLPAICFCGYVSGDAKRTLVRSSSFVAHPTPEREAFPLVLLEAAAACKAVICFNLATYRGIVQPGQNAEVVDQPNVEGLAAAIEVLVREPARRLAYERFNETWAMRFQWKDIARRYAEIFRTAARAAPGESNDR